MGTDCSRIKVGVLVGGREGGGSANSILGLVGRIDPTAFDVTVVACDDGPFTSRMRGAGQKCHVLDTGWPPPLRINTARGTRVRWVGYPLWLRWIARTVGLLCREIRAHRFDIIHSHYHHFHLIAAVACRLTGRRCVWHWRGQLEQPPPECVAGGSPGASPLGRLGFRWSLLRRLAWLIRAFERRHVWSIAVSQATLRSVRPFVGRRCTVVYNGVPDVGSAARGMLRSLPALDSEVQLVGMVATFNPRKGHHVFLEAAAEVCKWHADVHFVHIGGETAAGQGEYRSRLLTRTRELGLEGRVHWLGHRDCARELIADLNIATLCTLPPGEGFPLTILEAMVQGVPVISSDCGPAGEVITDGVTGLLVPPGDPKALAAAICRLLDDIAERERIGVAGERLCRERFDINLTVRQVENIYRGLLGRPVEGRGW